MCGRRELFGLLFVAAGVAQTDEAASIRDWLGETAARLTEENPDEFLAAFAEPLRAELDRSVRALVAAARISSSISIQRISDESGERRKVAAVWYLELQFHIAAAAPERRQEAVDMILEPVTDRRGRRRWRISAFTPLRLFAPPSL